MKKQPKARPLKLDEFFELCIAAGLAPGDVLEGVKSNEVHRSLLLTFVRRLGIRLPTRTLRAMTDDEAARVLRHVSRRVAEGRVTL